MRVLLDTNVVLDVLLKREPWRADASALWLASDEGRLEAWIAASVLTDIFYVVRRHSDLINARHAMQVCLDAFQIAEVNRAVLERAQILGGSDFEDNVLIACAELSRLDAIITRDTSGFNTTTVKALSPKTCVSLLARSAKN